MRAGGDVEENHFIRALFIVAEGEFHRVADIAQFARLGLAKLNAAGDLAVMNIETRNDTFCNHRIIKGGVATQGNRLVRFYLKAPVGCHKTYPGNKLRGLTMKTIPILTTGTVALLALLVTTGCASNHTGSPYQPGPVAGTAVGTGVGVAAGNVVGFGAGVVGGTVSGTKKVLNPSYHMVRYWKTEKTSDGRTIQVPYDILVDEYGRPVKMPAPTGNPAPPPAQQ